jgi:8-oxo-dGTP diphosphatase
MSFRSEMPTTTMHVSVDLIVFTVIDADLKVLLIRREQREGEPFPDRWALPGGHVDEGEDIEAAAHRELVEETNLRLGSCYLEQLYTFGKATRDPRRRNVSVAYFALVPSNLSTTVLAGSDASDVQWVSLRDLHAFAPLAFDHHEILNKAIDRLRGRIDYSNIAFDLVTPTFTIAELRSVYEAVKGSAYDPRNFDRRFRRMVADGVILPAAGRRVTAGKSAHVYSFRRNS